MFTPNEQSAGLVVKLPGANGRSLIGEDGKIAIDNITLYEVIVSKNGKNVSRSEPVGKDSIYFESLEEGEWSVDFTAYAEEFDAASGKSVKIPVAKNTEPKKVLIEANKTANVDVSALRIKYLTGYSGSSSYETSIKSGIILDFVNARDPSLSVSDYAKFEVEDPEIISIGSDGIIKPLKSGTTSLSILRPQDGAVIEEKVSVTIVPGVKIKFIVDGVDVSTSVDSIYRQSYQMSTEDLNDWLSSFFVYTIEQNVKKTGFSFSGWYFDSECTTESVPNNDVDGLDLLSKYNSMEKDGSESYEIKLYAKNIPPSETIGSVEDLKNAVAYGGSYKINNASLILTETIEVEKDFTLVFEGEGNEIGRYAGFYGKMFEVKSGGSLKFSPKTSGDILKLNGAVSGTTTGQILRLEGNAVAEFENTTFYGNAVNDSWAHPSAIAVTNNSKLKLKNCNIEDNSISGNQSRAPGIKVEAEATLEIDGATFKNNTCSLFPYGLDIWVEDMSANITLKGIITSEENISLHIKKSETTNKPINWQLDTTNSSGLNVTFGTSGESVCNISYFEGTKIFDKEGGLKSADTTKIHLFDRSNGELSESGALKIDSNGKVVVKQ